MSLTDIMVLQAVFGLAVVVFELPSGYVADRVGYRRSLAVGSGLWVAGWSLYAVAGSFAAVAAAEVVLGAANAFISGADRALLWVSLAAAGQQPAYMRWDARLRAAGQAAEAASAAAGGWLYALAPRLPMWLQVPAAALTWCCAVALTDVPRPAASERRSHAARAARIVRTALARRRLRSAIALGVALGLATFVMVWLIQPAAQARGVPVAWFGPLWAAAHAWLVAVSLASVRVAAVLGTRGALAACCALIAVGYAGLALTQSAWGLAFYLCFMAVRGLQAPILSRIMQEEAPEEDRASVLSLAALSFRLAFVVAGPPIGMLVDAIGIPLALAAMGAGFTALSAGALVAFGRAESAAAVAGPEDIRYRPEL